ncbi:MAG: metal-dependent transcriptional regulator [Lachnospiraceae bacterium]|nr:metal-dependent transcriptional regulator [Lachnospiraceae bacterium]
MKNSNSAEDYLKSIYVLNLRKGYVRAVDIASELGVTKPSVSAAMKKLRETGLIFLDKNGFICLTDAGRELAEKVNKKHTLITKFLIGVGVNEKIASKEACLIEHDIGEETFERLEALYERGLS